MQIVSFGCNRPVKFGMALSERMAPRVQDAIQVKKDYDRQGFERLAKELPVHGYFRAIRDAFIAIKPDWEMIGLYAASIMTPGFKHEKIVERPPLDARQQDQAVEVMKKTLRSLIRDSQYPDSVAMEALQAWKELQGVVVPDSFVSIPMTTLDNEIAITSKLLNRPELEIFGPKVKLDDTKSGGNKLRLGLTKGSKVKKH